MSELYIGLMSGTSIDAVDSVLVGFSEQKPKLIATHTHPIPNELRENLHDLCVVKNKNIYQLSTSDTMLGNLFAEAVLTLLNKTKTTPAEIKAIGSHGQTILHQPNIKNPFSLQIGDPNIIAARTGIITIADFRRKDIANKGQGAPLTPAFHKAIFQSNNQDRIILNIGGIANITILKANQKLPIIGFDTGPGNTLIDAWIFHNLKRPHDDKGEWASSGKINPTLLKHLLNDPYFDLPPPKSTGREYFNINWLKQNIEELSLTLAPKDIQATLTEFTAQTITEAINKYIQNNCDLIICGGGVHNDYLIKRLTILNKNHNVSFTDKVGVPADWVEAIAFAWLAKQTLNHQPIELQSITGSKKSAVLGGIYYP
jgi:anhydro-N-acetylmuramic acid kinase